MLSSLFISNFSVIKNAKIEFTQGLNIITGETGAGKTIMVNALKVLLGDKVNKESFRDERSPIYVEAMFTDISNCLDKNFKSTFDIYDELIIRREISALKNKLFINGRLSTLKELKNITSHLIEISGQFENQLLLNNTYHLKCIDSIIDKKILEEYRTIYVEYKELLNNIGLLRDNIKSLEANKNLIEFQREELESANIDLNKDNELGDKIKMLAKGEHFKKAVISILNDLKYGEVNANSLITNAIKYLDTIKDLSRNIEDILAKTNQIRVIMGDISDELERYIDNLDYNEEDLNKLVERKFYLDSLMNKYNTDLVGLLVLKGELSKKINNYSIDYINLKDLEKKLEVVKIRITALCDKLNKEREKSAEILEAKIIRILDKLELKNAQFKTMFKALPDMNENGNIEAEFFVSTNTGFTPAPVKDIVSGGELSRLMLALKEIFSDIDNIPTLIFDEIDTGISGATAKSVAYKLRNLAAKRQIIAITHLPVIAASGETHYHLNKMVTNNETVTEILCVDGIKRQQVLATMIAGSITDSSLKQASELLGM